MWYFAVNFPEILDEYKKNNDLNKLEIRSKGNMLKSGGGDPWWNDLWGTVENWWETGAGEVEDWWNSGTTEEEWDWFWDTIEDMAYSDVKGGCGGAIAGPGTAVTVGCVTSAWEGMDSLWDKYQDN